MNNIFMSNDIPVHRLKELLPHFRFSLLMSFIGTSLIIIGVLMSKQTFPVAQIFMMCICCGIFYLQLNALSDIENKIRKEKEQNVTSSY